MFIVIFYLVEVVLHTRSEYVGRVVFQQSLQVAQSGLAVLFDGGDEGDALGEDC